MLDVLSGPKGLMALANIHKTQHTPNSNHDEKPRSCRKSIDIDRYNTPIISHKHAPPLSTKLQPNADQHIRYQKPNVCHPPFCPTLV